MGEMNLLLAAKPLLIIFAVFAALLLRPLRFVGLLLALLLVSLLKVRGLIGID